MRLQIQSLALLSGLKIWHCCEVLALKRKKKNVPSLISQMISFLLQVINPSFSFSLALLYFGLHVYQDANLALSGNKSTGYPISPSMIIQSELGVSM